MKFRTFLTSLRYYFSEPAQWIQASGCRNPSSRLSAVKPGKKQILVNVISLTGVKFWPWLSVTRQYLWTAAVRWGCANQWIFSGKTIIASPADTNSCAELPTLVLGTYHDPAASTSVERLDSRGMVIPFLTTASAGRKRVQPCEQRKWETAFP